MHSSSPNSVSSNPINSIGGDDKFIESPNSVGSSFTSPTSENQEEQHPAPYEPWWVRRLQCFVEDDIGVPICCKSPHCPLNHSNHWFNHSKFARWVATIGLNEFDNNRKFYLGIASFVTLLTVFFTFWGCMALSTKRNIVQRTYWYAGTGHNSTDSTYFTIYIGLRSLEQVNCTFAPGYDNYDESCERHSIKWDSPECYEGVAAEACGICHASAVGMWFTAFINFVSLFLAWLGAQTRMRKCADVPAQKIIGIWSDTFGVVSLAFALLHFRYSCLNPLKIAYNAPNSGVSTHFWSGPGFICYAVCCLSGIVRSVAHWLTPVPGQGQKYIRQLFSDSIAERKPLWVFPSRSNLKKHWPVIRRRLKAMIILSPKFFFAAFFWQAFGYLALFVAKTNPVSAGYYLMTGLGTLLGFLLSSFVIIVITKNEASREEFISEFHNSVLVASAGGITAGTLWQVAVNFSINSHFNFSGAFFFVYLMSAVMNFLCAMSIRLINEYYTPERFKFRLSPLVAQTVHQEFTLALCVGAADAFFVGTDDRMLNYSWLSVFRVSRTTPTISALCLAGASALTGYLVCLSVVSVLWADGVVFVDDPAEPDPATTVVRRVGDRSVKFMAMSKHGEPLDGELVQNPVFDDVEL